MWNTILFDLDGTLTDPKVGITKAVAVALDHFGIREEPDHLTHFIGPPLDESFPEFYGFSQEQVDTATELFRDYYTRQGWRENIPYPGAADLLRDLKAAGRTTMIATSKPEAMAVQVLEHFGLAQYFEQICGAPSSAPDSARKADVVRRALGGAADPSRAVMVGDRRHDVEGARENGLPCIGVLYGYGGREELEAAGAEFIAEDMGALKECLL